MNPLVKAYFERDLSPDEEDKLHRLLETSESDALDFSARAEKHYAALGLAAASVLLAKGMAGKSAAGSGAGWLGKLLAGAKVMGAKAVVTAVAVTAVGVAGVTAVVASRAKEKPAPPPAQAEQQGDGLAISLELAKPTLLKIKVFSAQGRLVRDFGAKTYPAGAQELVWDGMDDKGAPVAGGRYRVQVHAGGKSMESWLEVR